MKDKMMNGISSSLGEGRRPTGEEGTGPAKSAHSPGGVKENEQQQTCYNAKASSEICIALASSFFRTLHFAGTSAVVRWIKNCADLIFPV